MNQEIQKEVKKSVVLAEPDRFITAKQIFFSTKRDWKTAISRRTKDAQRLRTIIGVPTASLPSDS
eukprot:463055-Rhodomonas_salina.1